jgi:hypothetical protein
MAKKQDEITELAIIFSEESVQVGAATYTVKPWTLDQMVALWPLMNLIAETLKDKIGAEKFYAYFDTSMSTGLMTMLKENYADVISVLLPSIGLFLSKCLGITEDEAKNMELTSAIALFMKAIVKNIEHLKNSLGPLMDEVVNMAGAVT